MNPQKKHIIVKELCEKHEKIFYCSSSMFFSCEKFDIVDERNNTPKCSNELLIKLPFSNMAIYQTYKQKKDYFPEYVFREYQGAIYYCGLPYSRKEIYDFYDLQIKLETNFGLVGGIYFGVIYITRYLYSMWEDEYIYIQSPHVIFYHSTILYFLKLEELFPVRFKKKYGRIDSIAIKELKSEVITMELVTIESPKRLYERIYKIDMEYNVSLLNYQILKIESEGYSLR